MVLLKERQLLYLSKLTNNHFIHEETMKTVEYLKLFFPFDDPDVIKNGKYELPEGVCRALWLDEAAVY